uniref:Peptidase M50 domain-containing protein n=1 Tax=Odontella aurita TaxID=265563 RepID=A0A7S4JVC5_9STRA
MHAADRKFKRGKGKGGPTRRIVKGEMREGESIEDFVRRTLGDGGDGDDGSSSAGGAVSTNGTSIEVEILDVTNGGEGIDVADLMMDMMRVPLWIPPSLLPYVITCPDELDPGDAKRIKAEVLKGSTFDCSGWDSFERGAIYRGSFVGRRAARTVAAMEGRGGRGGGMSVQKKEEKTSEISSSASGSTEPQQQQQQQQRSGEVFAEVQSRLVDSGLSERVQLFLLEDPEWRPGDANDETSGEYSGPPPALVALSKNVRPEQAAERGRGVKFLSGLSVAATMLATYAYVVSSYALNPTFFDAIVRENDAFVLTSTIPSFLGVLALQGAHELGHAAVARAKNVTLGLPVPLPSLQIGTFGSITPIRSFPETRTDLMDVALAGPGATAALSLAMMIVGIGATVGSSEEALAAMPVVPAALLRSSFLVGSLVSVLAPKVAALPLSQPVPIHPLFVVGLTGLISSALNLLPIGRLDGGRAYRSAFGRRPAVLTSFLFLLVMAIAALSGSSQLCIFWGLLVTVFQRNGDVPPRDEVTGVDATRRGLYGALTAVALLALLPFPGGPGAL